MTRVSTAVPSMTRLMRTGRPRRTPTRSKVSASTGRVQPRNRPHERVSTACEPRVHTPPGSGSHHPGPKPANSSRSSKRAFIEMSSLRGSIGPLSSVGPTHGANQRDVRGWNELHGGASYSRVGGPAAAIEICDDIRVQVDRRAVDQQKAARVRSSFETGALHVNEALEGDHNLEQARGQVERRAIRIRRELGLERCVEAQIDDEQVGGVREAVELTFVRGVERSERAVVREVPYDVVDHLAENRVRAEIADRQRSPRHRDRIRDVRQHVGRVVRDRERRLERIPGRSAVRRGSDRIDERVRESGSGAGPNPNLVERDVGESPGLALVGDVRRARPPGRSGRDRSRRAARGTRWASDCGCSGTRRAPSSRLSIDPRWRSIRRLRFESTCQPRSMRSSNPSTATKSSRRQS